MGTTKIEKKNRREAFKILGGLVVCGGGAFGIVHYLARREASADETVKLGAIAEYPVGEFQKRIVTVTEHGTWLTGPWRRRFGFAVTPTTLFSFSPGRART